VSVDTESKRMDGREEGRRKESFDELS